MRLATISTGSGTSAVRIDGDQAIECGASDVGRLLAYAGWEARASAADGETVNPVGRAVIGGRR